MALNAPYETWTPRAVADPRGATEAQLRAVFAEIIAVEGPMLAGRVYQAYSKAGGVARVTQAFRPKLNRVLRAMIEAGEVVAVDEFGDGDLDPRLLVVRLPDQPAVRLRDLGDRAFNEIPPSEIATRIAEIRDGRDLIGKEELTREVLGQYGLKRLTALVARHIDLALEQGA